MSKISLANKACVVTGAASGIGRATAILFGEMGASVVCGKFIKTFFYWLQSSGKLILISRVLQKRLIYYDHVAFQVYILQYAPICHISHSY